MLNSNSKQIKKNKALSKSLIWILIIDTIVAFSFKKFFMPEGIEFGGRFEVITLYITSLIGLFILHKNIFISLDKINSEVINFTLGCIFWIIFLFILYLTNLAMLSGVIGITISALIYKISKTEQGII